MWPVDDKKSEEPFANASDAWDEVTVGMLIEMLQSLPRDYVVRYDSAMAGFSKGQLKVYHDTKEISING
jgi:hypothetical protein